MNLFNQNYHIEIHMHKLQLPKKKKRWGTDKIS